MQRLKTRAQFQAVLAAGIAARSPHFALHRMPLDTTAPDGPRADGAQALFAIAEQPWVGVVVPKRWARRAVTRNTIKRQVFAVSARSSLPAAAWVVRLRTGFDRAQFTSATSEALKREVRGELERLFARIARVPA